MSFFRRCSLVAMMVLAAASACRGESPATVFTPPTATAQEVLGAREIRRYAYLRTGELLPPAQGDVVPAEKDLVIVATKQRPLLEQFTADAVLKTRILALGPQQYVLKTVARQGGRVLLVVGGDATGTLYGAYRVAEHLGVRFFMDGDVVPDRRIAWKLPELDETAKPLFELRGVNPWGSHPFGFDLWNTDDYKHHIGQLAKMRMNFIGMHCYPEGQPYAEPTVWIGLASDCDQQGRVTFSNPSVYYNAAFSPGWGGLRVKKTGDYAFGGAVLFDRDDWGPDALAGHTPRPATPAACNEVFNRTAAMFREAFGFARLVGVRTCIGTETPLTIPKALQVKLKKQGKNPADAAVVREVYEGTFRRIARAHPLDYYWLWTPESWTWRGNSSKQLAATVADIYLAYEAHQAVGSPCQLATSGWVLGPQEDRSALDKHLPKPIAISALSRHVGHQPIDPAFADAKDRPRWAIPWMEDDNDLASPQLWVGRNRQDAADALAYGCTGLLGLQWRTRILGPNIAALAQAGWDQSAFSKQTDKPRPKPAPTDGPLGGNVAQYPGRKIASADDAPLYQTCRYDMRGYDLKVPDGTYRVTLKFCEPHFDAAGQRVCDVAIQDKTVLENLDIFAKVGKFAAWDHTSDSVAVTDGRLKIRFVYRKSLPCISAIVIESKDFTRKINCGGPAYKDYAADVQLPGPQGANRALPTDDFYADWAASLFGPEAARPIAAVFQKIDGRLPRPGSGACPAGLRPEKRPWQQVMAEYGFVDELEQARAKVQGAGNTDRFDYWLGTLKYLRAMAKVECAWGQLRQSLEKIKAEKDARQRRQLATESGLPAYRQVLAACAESYGHLLATASTNGCLATVMYWEHAFFPQVLDGPAQQLAAALDCPLPGDCQVPRSYQGLPRIIVATPRSSLAPGETLRLKVIVLAAAAPTQATLCWRELGRGQFQRLPLDHVARGVYTVSFPPGGAKSDVEYYIDAACAGNVVRFPATAPALNQTLVLLP